MMPLQDLLQQVVNAGASDLHLSPNVLPHMRVSGDLIPIANTNIMQSSALQAALHEWMTPEQRLQFAEKLSLDMAITIDGLGSFRVSAFHESRGVAAVFRVIPEKTPSFEALGLPTALKTLLVAQHGLILVTGPTGSGKSTTLAAMIDHINAVKACHIVTIEDPIEFPHPNKKAFVNQLQVGRDATSFAAALRASLRQDPDVILIGELRDHESINLAMTAAETGHLVLATLHASSAPLSISRMIDVFPSADKTRVRNLLAETLQAIVCQNLVKRSDNGRIAAFEMMIVNPAVRHYIRQDMMPHIETVMQTSGDIGMCTMEQALDELVASGKIASSAARSVLLRKEIYMAKKS